MGGRTAVIGPPGNAYIWEFVPHHSLANCWGWAAQHRLLGELILGRPLRKSKDPSEQECVHHKDENKLNNDPSNLEILTTAQHRSHHSTEQSARKLLDLTAQQVAEALAAGGLKHASAALRCHPQTLRNRFPELLAPYVRRSPAQLSPETLSVIAHCHSQGMTQEQTAAKAGCSEGSVHRWAKRNGIAWGPNQKGRPRPRRSQAAHG